MRFREATEADIGAIAALTDGRNGLPLEPRVRQALPHVLGRLMSSPACTLTLFEEDGPAGAQPVSFAGGLFVREPVIERYLESPYPGLVPALLRDLLDGGQPLLTLDEIRRANAAGGLTLVVLPIPYGRWKWDDPTYVELRKLAPQAFLRLVGGYRLRAIYYEVFTDEIADYLRAGGYRLLHDFASLAGSEHFGPDCRPRMLRLTPADLPPGTVEGYALPPGYWTDLLQAAAKPVVVNPKPSRVATFRRVLPEGTPILNWGCASRGGDRG